MSGCNLIDPKFIEVNLNYKQANASLLQGVIINLQMFR